MNQILKYHIAFWIFLFAFSNSVLSKSVEYNITGKWAKSKVLMVNGVCNLDSTKLTFTTWTFDFFPSGKFKENDSISCSKRYSEISGRWKYEDNNLYLRRNAICIRRSKEYNYGKAIIGNIFWASPTLWYVCLTPDDSDDICCIIAYKKL